MYSTCIFCHSDLGKNESVEHFPIGRRLAFDAPRGRLWVVCRKCERWNLTPLEERWEAIEDCERLFSSTKLRVSTEHIGLARLRDGLELVRIGEPQRPEMAAWRYGDQFGRRRKRHLIYTGVGIAASWALIAGQLGGGMFVAGSAIFHVSSLARQLYQSRRARAILTLTDGSGPIPMNAGNLQRVWVEPEGRGWALNISYELRITGDDASRALSQLLPALNTQGGSRNEVESAIDMLERNDASRDALLRRWMDPRMRIATKKKMDPSPVLTLSSMPRATLLALEMATHEETERRALEGELNVLEEMWRQAEEIAAIADDLFVGDATRERLDALRKPKDEA